MPVAQPTKPWAQRGVTLLGLLFWAIVIGSLALVALRVLPTVNEYLTIQRAVDRVAAESPATVADVRKAFERQKEIEYSISSISAKDLQITKENERLVIRFAYDKEVPIVEPVYLLIKYEGRSR
jgi:Tfp pilus assembly major pilin PilA